GVGPCGGRRGRPHPRDRLFLYCGGRAPDLRGRVTRLRNSSIAKGGAVAEQSTLVIVKPDAVRRGLVGEILARIERKGLRIDELKMTRVSKPLARKHYAEHTAKPFFGELVEFITGGPIVVAKVTGRDAVTVV